MESQDFIDEQNQDQLSSGESVELDNDQTQADRNKVRYGNTIDKKSY